MLRDLIEMKSSDTIVFLDLVLLCLHSGPGFVENNSIVQSHINVSRC